MTNITQHIGLAHQPMTKSAITIIRDARAATKKEQKPHKNQAHLYKTLKIPVRLYT